MDSRNFFFMFLGFATAWLIVFGYVLSLIRRNCRLRETLSRTESMIGS